MLHLSQTSDRNNSGFNVTGTKPDASIFPDIVDSTDESTDEDDDEDDNVSKR